MSDIKTLSIDIETYSDVDLNKSGVYRYAESNNFDILLFGYSINGGSVIVIDLTAGEQVPEEVLSAITDEDVIKWAFNAAFERICLSYWLRRHYPQYFESYSIPEDSVCNYLKRSFTRSVFTNDDGYVFAAFSLGKIDGLIAKLAEVLKFY